MTFLFFPPSLAFPEELVDCEKIAENDPKVKSADVRSINHIVLATGKPPRVAGGEIGSFKYFSREYRVWQLLKAKSQSELERLHFNAAVVGLLLNPSVKRTPVEWINQCIAETGEPPRQGAGKLNDEEYNSGPYSLWYDLRNATREEMQKLKLSEDAIERRLNGSSARTPVGWINLIVKKTNQPPDFEGGEIDGEKFHTGPYQKWRKLITEYKKTPKELQKAMLKASGLSLQARKLLIDSLGCDLKP